MTQRGRGRKRVRETFNLYVQAKPCVSIELWFSEKSKFEAGDKVRVTVELLARTRKGGGK